MKDGDDSFSLIFSLTKNTEVAHCGRELRLGRGDATVLHVCKTGSVGSREKFGYLHVPMRSSEIEARGACLDSAVMKPLSRHSESVQLLSDYIRSLEKIGPVVQVEVREIVRGHIIDLIVLGATARRPIGESRASAVVAARLTAALDHIAAHFQDPKLNLETVAGSQGISTRYLQRLMESSGTSFITHVHELRLQKAFALLTESGYIGRISDIALKVGFSDISHFNRLFRARFGDTPSGVRRTVDVV